MVTVRSIGLCSGKSFDMMAVFTVEMSSSRVGERVEKTRTNAVNNQRSIFSGTVPAQNSSPVAYFMKLIVALQI